MTNPDIDIFKSATESVIKAMSKDGDTDVAFVAGSIPGAPATAAGQTLRIPLPDHNMDADNIALVRGSADAAALYRDHHNADIHRKNAPRGGEAASVFSALEHMRCEALGAKAMSGVGRNISAVMEQKCKMLGYDKAADIERMPLADALHLKAYYDLTDITPPPAVAQSLEPWAERLEGMDMQALVPLLDNQDAFADQSRALLQSWGLESPADDTADEEIENDTDSDGSDEEHPQPEDEDQGQY